MAHVRKGHLVRSPQWAKHLKDWKRVFWSSHRMAERKLIKREIRNEKV